MHSEGTVYVLSQISEQSEAFFQIHKVALLGVICSFSITLLLLFYIIFAWLLLSHLKLQEAAPKGQRKLQGSFSAKGTSLKHPEIFKRGKAELLLVSGEVEVTKMVKLEFKVQFW